MALSAAISHVFCQSHRHVAVASSTRYITTREHVDTILVCYANQSGTIRRLKWREQQYATRLAQPSQLSHSSRDVATCLILSVPLSNTIIEVVLHSYLVALIMPMLFTFADPVCLFKTNLWDRRIYSIYEFFFFLIQYINILYIYKYFISLRRFSNQRAEISFYCSYKLI